jgi:UDP-N-acetyl-2-amino-2-deoxyglucuronate dehydrogenase
MTNFALIGVGYIAQKHLKAIKEVGNLVAACDVNDSVGILDNFFPKTHFFKEIERFDEFIEGKVDYVTICTPNYLHQAHIRLGLRHCDVICEKPMTLGSTEYLEDLEVKYGHKVYGISQLRLHPAMITPIGGFHEVEVTYHAVRGPWYQVSWKGDESKSGGIITNLGIHMFDALIYLFGACNDYTIDKTPEHVTGTLRLARANVKFDLATCFDKVNRKFVIDGEELNFNEGFYDLHTKSYQKILEGKGLRIEDVRGGLELCKKLRG